MAMKTKSMAIFIVSLAFIVFANIVRQASKLNTNSKVSLQSTKYAEIPFNKTLTGGIPK